GVYESGKAGLDTSCNLSSLAEVELRLGRVAAAIEQADRAAGLARSLQLPDMLWPALAAAGIGYQLTHQPAKARAAFAEGIATVDVERKQLAGGEQEGQQYLRNKIGLFQGLIAL